MNNIELLEMIAAKVTALRNEINDLGVEIKGDHTFWPVHDAIVSIVSDLEGAADTAVCLAEEIEY